MCKICDVEGGEARAYRAGLGGQPLTSSRSRRGHGSSLEPGSLRSWGMVGDKGRLLPGLWTFSGWGWCSGCATGVTQTLTSRCMLDGPEKVPGAGGREGEGTGIGM